MPKYKSKIIQDNAFGFGAESKKKELKRKEDLAFYILGYSQWIPFESLPFDSFSLFHKWQVEGREVFECLGSDAVSAKILLSNGPWTSQQLGPTLRELDVVAWDLDAGRRDFPQLAGVEMLEAVYRHGLETFHNGLLEKHAESVAAVAELTEIIEGLGAEMIDSGAYYDADGNQEGGRDVVFDLQDDTELLCTVYHSPRHVEVKYDYDRPIPPDIAEAIKQWELA